MPKGKNKDCGCRKPCENHGDEPRSRNSDVFYIGTPGKQKSGPLLNVEIPKLTDKVAEAVAEALNPYNNYFRRHSPKVILANRIAEKVREMDIYRIPMEDRASNMRRQIETALNHCDCLPTAEPMRTQITNLIKKVIRQTTGIVFDEVK